MLLLSCVIVHRSMVSLLSAHVMIIIMYAAKFNANVSSNPKISAESRDDISKLYIVNRSKLLACACVSVNCVTVR